MNPSALAVAPFETVDLSLIQKSSEEIFKDLNGFNVNILPWISAYVGGDIVSGMYCIDLMKEEKNTLFIGQRLFREANYYPCGSPSVDLPTTPCEFLISLH